jgi:hypothetical protein
MNITKFKIQIVDTFDNDRVLAHERTEKGNPVLNYPGSDDKYVTLMASELSFNISVPGAADGAFFHLYSGNDTRYRTELYDQDDVLLWQGFLMPDQYSEPYKSAHYFVAMTATDGIGRLKGKTLDYQYYNGEHSVMKLISECLRQTGLSQIINFAPAVEACNGYRWDEIAVDVTTYRDEKEPPLFSFVPQKKPKRKNAYEILDLLVKSIGCTVFTWGGEWYIIGINRKHEIESPVQRYSATGVYMGTAMLTRPVQNMYRKTEATPATITVISPWKTVNITWNIDEDGNLLPEDVITESTDRIGIDTGNSVVDLSTHGLPNEVPLKHWEKFGGISAGVASANGTGLRYWPDFSFIPLVVPMAPFNLSLGYTNPATGAGETQAGVFFRNIHLKKPKFIKPSDAYLLRYLKLKVNVFAPGAPDVSEAIENGTLKDFFQFDITVNDITLYSSRPGAPGHDLYQYEMEWRSGIAFEDTPDPDVTKYSAPQLTGKLQKEVITVPEHGFINLKFFAPVSPNPADPLGAAFTFTELELEYTAQDEFFDELTRDIDFTTVYDLETYHGDSVQDLSKKQWRFRRPLPVPENITDINIFSVEVQTILTTIFKYYISYAQAQLILQNTGFLTVTWVGSDYVINNLYPNPDYAFGDYWNVVQDTTTGAWFVYVKKISDTGIWADAQNFTDMFLNIDLGEAYYGFVPEDNLERESWKRYGKTEDLRYLLALGRVYHDVQPEPIVNVDGLFHGIYNPLELFGFDWMESRQFIPLRLTLDFSAGKTEMRLQESKITDVNDYIV